MNDHIRSKHESIIPKKKSNVKAKCIDPPTLKIESLDFQQASNTRHMKMKGNQLFFKTEQYELQQTIGHCIERKRS